MKIGEQTNTNLSFEKMMDVAVKYLPGGKTVRPMPVEVELDLSKFTKETDKVEKYVLDDDHKFYQFTGEKYYVQMESVLAFFGFEMMRPAYFSDAEGNISEVKGTKYDHITVQYYDGEKWVDAVTVYRGREKQLNVVDLVNGNDVSVVDEFGQNIVLLALQPNTGFRVVVFLEENGDIQDWLENSDFTNNGGRVSVIYHGLAITYDFNDYLPKKEQEVTPQTVGGVIGELYGY